MILHYLSFWAFIALSYMIISDKDVLSFPEPQSVEQINSKHFLFMEKQKYESPQVEVLEIEVEQGFAASNGAGESPYDVWPSGF